MDVISTEIPDVKIVEPVIFRDARGYFVETYNAARYAEAGIAADFVQDNESCSSRGVLRGLHWQACRHAQAKLVRVTTRGLSPLPKKPIGILAAYDDAARRILDACHSVGLRVPSEVSVLGSGVLGLSRISAGRFAALARGPRLPRSRQLHELREVLRPAEGLRPREERHRSGGFERQILMVLVIYCAFP